MQQKKRLHRTFLFLTASGFILSLSGCTNANSDASNPDPDYYKGKVIKVRTDKKTEAGNDSPAS